MKRKIEAQLLAWKEKETGRMPLILGGARQIGKTYILRQFGKEHFKNVVYINLETNQKMVEYFQESIVPDRLLRYMGALVGERIVPGQTLIILDEIQSCERALTALKYFCEEMPEYHIAASGSLLGVAVNRQNYSFPVGKVESLMLHPFDFEEYLWAKGEEALSSAIRDAFVANTPLEQPLHEKAAALYREYLLVGGMPASINRFLQTGSLEEAAVVQREILDNYIADMAKYASAAETVQIRTCYRSIPAQLQESRKVSLLRKSKSPAQLFGGSVEWLKFAGIVLESRQVLQAVQPVEAQAVMDENRLYLSDVGLMAARAGICHETVLQADSNAFLQVLEQNYLAQQFDAQGYPLYFWRHRSGIGADFVLQKGAEVIGVSLEKSGKAAKRGQNAFAKQHPNIRRYRFADVNFGQQPGVCPMYAAFCL